MSEKVSSNNINVKNISESYIRNSGMQNYAENEDITIFDDFSEDFETESDLNSNKDKESQINELKSQLETVKDEQGIIGSMWNGIKCLTNLGSSSEKCEDAIENFEKGEISYEEAQEIISKFSDKQKNSVNMISNIATGVTTALVIGSAVATGGLSLGVIGVAAGAGALVKTGLKFTDRATNKVQGDAVDGKQIIKDSLSGAVEGAATAITAGIGNVAVTGETVAAQTMKETVIQGVKSGAEAGAAAGAITGSSDYMIEAMVEEDVDFKVSDLAKSTLSNTVGGALAGGVLSGASTALRYNSVNTEINNIVSKNSDSDKVYLNFDDAAKIYDKSNELNKIYASNIDEAEQQIKDKFDNLSSVEKITAREKSQKSVMEKLSQKFRKNKLKSITEKDCLDAIGDAYGTRIQIKNLTPEESLKIIKKGLKGTDVSYEQFIKYMTGNKSELDDAVLDTLDNVGQDVLNSLKEAQTQEVVDNLIKGINNKSIKVTELNNYGDEMSSYFTEKQLLDIADAVKDKTGEKLNIVTKASEDLKIASYVNENKYYEGKSYIINEENSIKDSGYTSSQMNLNHEFKNSDIGLGELQIRGTEVNEFADIEHIPYDIRKGKIGPESSEYSGIYNLIQKMDDKSFNDYNSYLKDVYNYLRLKELGIDSTEPVLKGTFLAKETNEDISSEVINKLSKEALENLAHH